MKKMVLKSKIDNFDKGKIFKKLNNFAIGSSIFLDIPEVNKDSLELVNKYKMKPIFETARMYTKKPPEINLNKVFGITTFELG